MTDLPMEKVMLQFFNQFEIDGLKEGVIVRLINAGFDTINDILRLKEESLLDVEGFQIKSSSKLVKQIKDKIIDKEHSLSKIMVASNCFPNFGIKKIKLVTDNFKVKEILNNKIPREGLCNIEGLGEITSNDFLKHLPNFLNWLKEHSIIKIASDQNNKIDSRNKNKDKIDLYINRKNIVFTGFRDKELEEYIEENNGKLQSGVSGTTNLVVAKDITETSSKIKKATDKGIKVISLEEFLGIINYNQ
jgi:DNA ligase (NAD+)